ncbi:uncharacterized protein LOC126835749 [Adelges cooleyi]|uniref:uncharacterized protein LOC126835749 n=1 Tax=Adelges cooleyi TaxID=133065 RepID=UPI0021804D78|nr:uncharacterized protein LOC126835749 [Adelges cooleyi]
MIFYIIFIPYAFVSVLADNVTLDEYMTELHITNEYMAKAYSTLSNHRVLNGLAHTIKKVIRRDAYTTDELNFMFATPDQADVFDLYKHIGYERILQNEIFMALHINKPPVNRVVDWSELGDKRREMTRKAIILLLDIDICGEYITELQITNEYMEKAYNTIGYHGNLNGLAYTIKKAIRRDVYTMEELNCMFAIPDQADIFELNKYIGYERILQNDIFMALHISRPLVNRVVDWTDLGHKRRTLTRKAIVQLLSFDISGTYSDYYSLIQKCRLIGLALSTKDPLRYTKTVEINNYDTCFIINASGIITRYKAFRSNEFHEVHLEPYATRGPRLIDQLNIESSV